MPVKEVQSSDDAVSKAEFCHVYFRMAYEKEKGGRGKEGKRKGKKPEGEGMGKKRKEEKTLFSKMPYISG